MFKFFNKTEKTKEFLGPYFFAAIESFDTKMHHFKEHYGYVGPQYSKFEPTLFVHWCYIHGIHNQKLSIKSTEELKDFINALCISKLVQQINPNNLPRQSLGRERNSEVQWLDDEFKNRFSQYNNVFDQAQIYIMNNDDPTNFLNHHISYFSRLFIGEENYQNFIRQWRTSLLEIFAEIMQRPLFELHKARNELGLK